jgi:molecular chaperone DnaK (HSP70)
VTLVIDFGTVNTVGMVDGRLVTVDGAPWLPSVVYDGVVGVDATLLGRGREHRDLKARLAPDEVGAVFTRVLSAAREQGWDGAQVVVTHPAGWAPERVAVLTAAAGSSSSSSSSETASEPEAPGASGQVRTMVEPIAVAAGVPAGEFALVVDAGGGTWDAAVVRDGVLRGASSVPVDIDQRIVERVRPSLSSPDLDDAARADLLAAARTGKELLSRHDIAEIVLPDHRAVRLTRAEFQLLIAKDVNRLTAAVTEVCAGVAVTRVLLVGGASRMPLLAIRLSAAIGHHVVPDPEPETAVVRGAYLLTRAPEN